MTTAFAILFVIALIVDVTYRKLKSGKMHKIVVQSYNDLLDEKRKFFAGIVSKVITIDNVYERCKVNGIEKYVVLNDNGKNRIRNILSK